MILVTGGSRGIGRASVLAALAAGYEVLAVARGEDGLNELLAKSSSNKLHILAADLSTAEGCSYVAEWIKKYNIQIAALVNNAGSYTPAGLTGESDDALPDLLNLNLLAAHRLTRLLLPIGLKRIITIGSVAALDLPERMAAYTVSKYALHAWHLMLKKELDGRETKCSLIIPGATLTSAWEKETVLPMRILQPDRVADLVLQCLKADEGLTIEIRP